VAGDSVGLVVESAFPGGQYESALDLALDFHGSATGLFYNVSANN